MKLYCLSHNPSKPCFVLRFKGITLMLDCGLDITQLQHFLPLPVLQSQSFLRTTNWTPPSDLSSDVTRELSAEIQECGTGAFIDCVPEFATPELSLVDITEIDAILLSNFNCLLALPFVTEYTGFRGVIYATEPTLQLGRLYLEEMVSYMERHPGGSTAKAWKLHNLLQGLPHRLKEAINPLRWKKIYSRQDIESCLSRVKTVGFNEKKEVYGALTILATSSGFCLGSSNWIIHTEYEKICYVSGSSTLTTHPQPMEHAPLKNSDVLILSCLSQAPLYNPDNMIGDFCRNVAVTLKNGGNVLIPCYSSGIIYDLFECLSGHLDTCGLSSVPLYFLSPVSDSTLAYSNIFAEWLSQSKQSKVYLPEPPFPHAELVTQKRLRHFANIHDASPTDFRTPCVVFCGHPTLRFGDVVHFISLWGSSSSNTIILTEPDVPYLEALAPFQPLAMKVCYCPIDTSLSFNQANKLIKELHPLNIAVPECNTKPPISHPHRTDLIVDSDINTLTYNCCDVITLPVTRQYERIEITCELAQTLEPTEIKPGSTITMVTGALTLKDNKYTLKSVPREITAGSQCQADGSRIKRKPYVFGKLDVAQFVSAIAQKGITDVKVEDTVDGHIIHLRNDDTLIQIEPDSTHIICDGNEAIRVKLRDTLLQCLSTM